MKHDFSQHNQFITFQDLYIVAGILKTRETKLALAAVWTTGESFKKLPSRAQTAPRSDWFKGGMLIRSKSIKLRKALCLGPKNNFPTLSPLCVLGWGWVAGGQGEAESGGGGVGGCRHMYILVSVPVECLCFQCWFCHGCVLEES